MPADYVDVRHDDDRYYRARVLHRYRTDAGWRYVLTYTVGVGMTYLRGVPADQLRAAADDDQHEAQQLGHADHRDDAGHDVACARFPTLPLRGPEGCLPGGRWAGLPLGPPDALGHRAPRGR
jgi:hypothetical protein